MDEKSSAPTAEAVRTVFFDSMFRDDELGEDGKTLPEHHVPAYGILVDTAFHPERLESHREEVAGWLQHLPDDFHEHSGGGASFLNACYLKGETQQAPWGEHRNMEQLFMLGTALGLAECLMPRSLWSILPGGMPYYMVKAPVTPPDLQEAPHDH